MRLYLIPLLLWALVAGAVDVPIMFDGGLVDATTTDDSYNTGGTIELNGVVVTVPKNMLVTFPAAFVPWKDFVAEKSKFIGWEISVTGNTVDGVNLAAQIFVSEFALEMNQGYIESLDFDGSIKILNGPTIRLNDPNAAFSAGYSFPFMVVDDQSPSVTAFSGFPMCVPRSSNDTMCPESNRPRVAGSNAPRRIFPAPDPLIMAPFLPGDFIQYRGFRSAANEIVCFDVVAWNVQITTTTPVYIRGELALVGVFDEDPNVEVAETRFIGVASNPSVTISVTAMDIDPCTGAITQRPIAAAVPRTNDPRNKWLARFTDTQRVEYTREYRFISSTGTTVTKNGLIAGQYIAPVGEWIQAELDQPGNELPPHQFNWMGHLTKGVGPDEDGNIWGPLDPFPQSGVTVFNISTCPPTGGNPGNPGGPIGGTTPDARIEATIPTNTQGTQSATVTAEPIFVRKADTFALRGFQDNQNIPTNDTLVWTWSLDADSVGTTAHLSTFSPAADGKSVAIKFANSAPDGDYTFKLSIQSLGQNRTGTATFVATLFSGADQVTIQSVQWTSSQSGTLGVTCKSNYLADFRVNMQVTYPGDRGTQTSAMSPTPPGSGLWSFSARRIDRPGTITCQSSLGGVATRSGTTSKRAVSPQRPKRNPRLRASRFAHDPMLA